MKILEFKKNTIWWRLAAVYDPMSKYDSETNICTYLRSVFFGSLLVILCMLGGGLLSFPVAWTLAWALSGFPFPEIEALIFPAFLVIFGVVIGFIALIDYLLYNGVAPIRYTKQLISKNVPSFLKEAYRSFKEKTCYQVSFLP